MILLSQVALPLSGSEPMAGMVCRGQEVFMHVASALAEAFGSLDLAGYLHLFLGPCHRASPAEQ